MLADSGKMTEIPAACIRVSQVASCEKFEKDVFSFSELRELRKSKCANKRKTVQ